MQHLTFNGSIEASDSGRRVISGVIVPFNQVGDTSVGKVIFERGSIKIDEPTKIKLVAQHDQTKPIGRAQGFQETATGITASFKISASSRGTDYLIMASEGLINGLSVGVNVIDSRPGANGVLHVIEAELEHVGLVETPAFKNANVTQVAASQNQPTNEGAPMSTEAPVAPVAPASDPVAPVAPVAAPVEAAAVQAAAPANNVIIMASGQPYSTQRVRHGIDSKGRYTEHKIRAAMGNEESKLWIAAAEDPKYLTAAADSMSTNPAFNPIQYLQQFVSNTNFGRPAIDAVTKAQLPASGLTLNIPGLVTSAGGGSDTAPTVAATAESGTPSNTGATTAYQTVTISKYAGQQTISLELLERSDPIFFDQLTIQMERAYLAATDAALIAILTAQGIQSAVTATTAAGIMSFISTESANAYQGSSYFAENLISNPTWWAALMGYADTTGRPLYTAAQPWNANGKADPTSIKGNVLGLNLYVDKNVTTGLVNESLFIVAPDTVTWWESPTSYFSVNNVSNGQIQTAIYGYGAGKVLIPAGVRRFRQV